jgi:hypothetical protein
MPRQTLSCPHAPVTPGESGARDSSLGRGEELGREEVNLGIFCLHFPAYPPFLTHFHANLRHFYRHLRTQI